MIYYANTDILLSFSNISAFEFSLEAPALASFCPPPPLAGGQYDFTSH